MKLDIKIAKRIGITIATVIRTFAGSVFEVAWGLAGIVFLQFVLLFLLGEELRLSINTIFITIESFIVQYILIIFIAVFIVRLHNGLRWMFYE